MSCMPCLMMWSVLIHCLYPWAWVGLQCWFTLIIGFSTQSWSWWGMISSFNLGLFCQESSQNLTLFPFLISQKLCYWIRSLCYLAAFQIKELGPTYVSLIKSCTGLLLAYFVVQRIAQGLCGSEIHFHQMRAPMTALMCWGSRSPVLP